MIDLINSRIDRYELRERIGSGGMARVYKAWDTNLERLVAIKILHEHLADDPTFKERFEREAKFVAGLSHPNIVQVYDFDVINRDGVPLCYMVMSYIPGQTLREVMEAHELRGERLPIERVREIVADLASALGYAHQRGMVHRDVKPGNILLNETGRAILTDFGIARLVQSNRLTADGVSTGTPVYMSPEQASGHAGDMRSDLYSLGIIVYEMLTGQPPFADDTSLAVMLKHLNTPPPLPSDAIRSRDYDAFILRALAKEPDHRYQTAGDFLRAFNAASTVPDFEKTTILPSQHAIPVVKDPDAPAPVVAVPRTTLILQTISQKARENPRTSGAIVVAALGAVALLVLLMMNSPTFKNAQAAPTLAPTVVATAAPTTVPATSAPNVDSMTSSAIYFDSSFDSGDAFNQYWSTEGTQFLTRAFTPDGYYRMHNAQPFTAETSIYPSASPYGSISIEMLGRLDENSQSASGYGIVFRYQDENNYNVFAVDGQGRYSVWMRKDGVWNELRHLPDGDAKWTPDDSILPMGKFNDLSVTVLGAFVTGYVNGKQLVRVNAGTLPAGRIGMYFATDKGEATVSVDSYRVFSSVPSMTDGS